MVGHLEILLWEEVVANMIHRKEEVAEMEEERMWGMMEMAVFLPFFSNFCLIINDGPTVFIRFYVTKGTVPLVSFSN